MRYVVSLAILVSALLLWGQAGSRNPTSQPPARSYELTAKTEMKSGIRPYAETTYTLIQNVGTTKRELWRVLQGDKYAHHWISPRGMVWVLTEGMTGPGGATRLWARDLNANQRGVWGVVEWYRLDTKGTALFHDANLDIDLAASKALSLGSGSEQLRLVTQNGSEIRATIAETTSGPIPLSRYFAKGESKADRLTEFLDKPYGPPRVEWPAGRQAPIAIWTFPNEQNDTCLIQTYGPAYEFATAPKIVVSERTSPRKPVLVDRTLSGKLLWFEFGQPWEQPLAKLDILRFDGTPIQSVDLLKLGEFQTSDAARRAIQYRDVMDDAGGGFEPLDSTNRYGNVKVETLAFSDRTGRKYRVVIAAAGNSFSVKGEASMNLSMTGAKEPTYPDSTLESKVQSKSADGKFEARVKNYVQAGKTQSQLTFLAHVNDPIEGRKSVELFSVPLGVRPQSIKVSNSGRVFALSFAKNPAAPDGKQEMVLFQAWDPTGRSMGFDLVTLKWFDNAADAKGKIDLARLTIELEGLKAERIVDKVPVPTYLMETLAFDLGGGRVERLYIGYMNEQMPTIFYKSKPKSFAK